MFQIIGNNMYLPKGDTAVIRVRVYNTDGTVHKYARNDSVTLTIRDKANSSATAKTYTTTCSSTNEPEYLDIKISASASSGIAIGQYAADITYRVSSSSDVYTIFPVWVTKGDSRKMLGQDYEWNNFWVLPNVRG